MTTTLFLVLTFWPVKLQVQSSVQDACFIFRGSKSATVDFHPHIWRLDIKQSIANCKPTSDVDWKRCDVLESDDPTFKLSPGDCQPKSEFVFTEEKWPSLSNSQGRICCADWITPADGARAGSIRSAAAFIVRARSASWRPAGELETNRALRPSHLWQHLGPVVNWACPASLVLCGPAHRLALRHNRQQNTHKIALPIYDLTC